MPTESGRVAAIEADALWIETRRGTTCGGCAARRGCGHALIEGAFGGRCSRIRIETPAQDVARCTVGDEVFIRVADSAVLRGALVACGLPLLGLLAGACSAALALPGTQDLAAAGGAVIGLLLGYALVHRHGVRHRGDAGLQPVLLGRASVSAHSEIPH